MPRSVGQRNRFTWRLGARAERVAPCCSGSSRHGGIGSTFDVAYAAEKLARYRSHGPDPSTRALLRAITAEGVNGKTLLDIGGGVGALQHELLRYGVIAVQEVEASAAYIAACRDEAERRGHASRITHVYGDFGSVADEVTDADIVTLDRSVCCWDAPLELVDQSASKARWLFGLTYPRDVWWVRHGWRRFGNLKQLVKRSSLRLSAPRTADIDATVARHGLSVRHRSEVGVWQVALYGTDVR